jgi:DNA recombination protein RmuC
MSDITIYAVIGLGILAVVIALVGALRPRTVSDSQSLTREQAADLFRGEHDRLRSTLDEQLRGVRTDLGGNLEAGIARIEGQTRAIDDKLGAEMEKQAKEATENRDKLRAAVEERLILAATAQADAAVDARTVLLKAIQDHGKAAAELMGQIGEQQKERLELVTKALAELTALQEQKLEAMRKTVEEKLELLRTDNTTKLEEMRQTVDEKLKTTLETRLGESFNRVVEQLERVHTGIGEMKSLATGVGDLKKVLSNVSVRGALGEIQLAMLLEQFLSPEQVMENATVREGSLERVEFAVRLPGRDGENEVLLPIDAKFPQEDYQRLLEASERGDVEAVQEAGAALETRIRQFARTIREKYIVPPRTTDFAVLFLPTEGLYAEVLRRPGLFEQLQREHHVTLAGPTTLTALLNALQMGFRSVAIEKRSSEVWQVLGAVRTEFGKYNEVVDRLGKQLNSAANSVDSLGRRTRAMSRTLRTIETLPAPEAAALLGFDANNAPDDGDERDEA